MYLRHTGGHCLVLHPFLTLHLSFIIVLSQFCLVPQSHIVNWIHNKSFTVYLVIAHDEGIHWSHIHTHASNTFFSLRTFDQESLHIILCSHQSAVLAIQKSCICHHNMTIATACFYLCLLSAASVAIWGWGSVWGKDIWCEGGATATWGSVQVRQGEVQVVL